MPETTCGEIRARVRALDVPHDGPDADPMHGPGIVLRLAYGGANADRLERGGLRVTPVGPRHVLVRPEV